MPQNQETVRLFNRFELKYLLPVEHAAVFKKAIKDFMRVDSCGENGEYALTSLYYDTPDHRFYREKIDGIEKRRKLRIRHYETGDQLKPETPVFLEIKARDDRVIHKRRVKLPYREAINLCDNVQMPPTVDPRDRAALEEALGMVLCYRLKPSVITSYFRHALVGTDYDLGLRVTFDTNIRYRDRDLDLSSKNRGKFMLPPTMAVMEIKANGSIPYWLTEMIAAYNISLIRVSKYCLGLDAAKKKIVIVISHLIIINFPQMDELIKALETQLDFKDLSGTFSLTDVIIVLILSTLLTALIAWVYKLTHKGTSYTQSFVHTLILMGIITSVIMMIVGSNIARAFALVGALSIIRFRNAVKETRDVGFLFLAMSIGMATGTKFYLLAVIFTLFISLVILVLNRFDLYKQKIVSQILKIELPRDTDFHSLFDNVFVKYTKNADLISIDSVRSGTTTELIYNIVPKRKISNRDFIEAVRKLNGNNKVTLVTGYDNTDL